MTEKVMRASRHQAHRRTEKSADGKIFVTAVESVVRIRLRNGPSAI